MDLLYAKSLVIITDCVIAELEKLGNKFRPALLVSKNPRWTRLRWNHSGSYVGDCIIDTVSELPSRQCCQRPVCERETSRTYIGFHIQEISTQYPC